VSPADADYNFITRRSLTYGYGRINAADAVAAAAESRDTGLTWPDRVASVSVTGGNTLRWQANDDLRNGFGDETVSFLVVEKAGDAFQWVPTDGEQYSAGTEVAEGAVVVVDSNVTSYTFDDQSGQTLFFAIFAQNAIGRYSWGVAVDSLGNVTDPGTITGGGGGPGGDGDGDTIIIPPGVETPKVSISAEPLSGFSPLTVQFRGNAQTDSDIVSTLWDFGDGSSDTRRTTEHTYTVAEGTTQSFKATFTVEDEEGDVGERSLLINVSSTTAPDTDDGTAGSTNLKILLADPRTGDTTGDAGIAPYTVQFSVDFSEMSGTFAGITWFFGDGTPVVESLTAVHTYESPGTFAASATVRTQSPSGAIQETSATKVITVLEDPDSDNGDGDADNGNDADGDGTPPDSGIACGAGILAPFAGLVAFSLLRRRFT
jgi:uncharacterized protein (TIGR03382 family)